MNKTAYIVNIVNIVVSHAVDICNRGRATACTFTICVRSVWIVVRYLLLKKEAFNGISKVIGIQNISIIRCKKKSRTKRSTLSDHTISLWWRKRDFTIEKQFLSQIMKYSIKCLSYPLPFYATQIINPFLSSRFSDNHDKVGDFQQIVKSL